MGEPELRVVVAGVAGSGKTTIGELVAARLAMRYLDGDSMHSAANVEKMKSGSPLTDADRSPWLDTLKQELASASRIVISCSALRRNHRDILASVGSVRILFLDVERDVAIDRARHREGHFMGPDMVDSQFSVLERPSPMEEYTTVIAANGATEEVLEQAMTALRR
jgi:carbohydrate kinase (thermoresistant glucokinase family)